MFSQSSSNNANRLQKARSSTFEQRSSTAISDPFITRHHAEVAASEAYKRVRPTEQPAYPGYRPVPPKPQRRKSQVSGRSEGSHLEDARLGRRRSTRQLKRDDKNVDVPPRKPHRQALPAVSQAVKEGETVITRRRSIIPPISAPARPIGPQQLDPLTTARHQRRTLSNFGNGSPAPRSSSVVRSPPQDPTPRFTDKSYEEGISIRYKQPYTYADRASAVPPSPNPRPSTRETQTDADIVALARDQCLQGFQHKKIRERKSLFFGSLQKLQKRSVTEIQQTHGLAYDNSIPPFNYADESLAAPIPLTQDTDPPIVVTDEYGRPERKTRMFSESMKGRFKKLLRKASKAPGGLPAQQVEAKHLHYSVIEADSPLIPGQAYTTRDPFIASSAITPLEEYGAPVFDFGKLSCNASESGDSAADKSRVTSWTTSTIAGTASTRANNDASTIDENGRLRQSSSISTLRKKSSSIGRTIQDRMRRSSRAELRSSDESRCLSTALQDRIRPAEKEVTAVQDSDCVTSINAASRASLPSQARASSQAASTVLSRSTNVQTVTPDPDAFKLPTMSPVLEASPDRNIIYHDGSESIPLQIYSSQARNKRLAIIMAPALSPEQIARRVQKTQNRWQSTLNAASIVADRLMSGKYGEDNPYEQPSLSRNPYEDPGADTGGLPQHTRVVDQRHVARENLLSPSLYSRATDDASSRPQTPGDENGTMITITSRQIKRYELSPPKQRNETSQRPAQGSREWRKWLSDEMHEFAESPGPGDLTLPDNAYNSVTAEKPTTTAENDSTAIAESSSQRQASASPALQGEVAKATRPGRPRAASRRSSYMNERYPLVESSRNSSRQSGRTSRKFSMADSERSRLVSGSDDTKQSVDSVRPAAHKDTSRHVKKRHSVAVLESAKQQIKSAACSTCVDPADNDRYTMSGALPDTVPATESTFSSRAKAANKAKSAFDLRVNYRSTTLSTARPLEVRRKPTNFPVLQLDDNTIRNISAGPYAAPSPSFLTSTGIENKENTPPLTAADESGLPALSSSEWLAGPTSKKRTAAVPSYKAGDRYSSPAKLTAVGREGASPGQRMATGWLEGRKGGAGKSRENSPAFV